jgi:tetratricopeptide (TPR) repeat protein
LKTGDDLEGLIPFIFQEEIMQENIISSEPVYVPECQVCRVQDETLRVISLPYVVSIVFMTFQRSFDGIYCKKHRRLYHFLASLITSLAGWLGIPFGFVFTPIALYTLAQGGKSDPRVNFELQNRLANKKLMSGDVPGAMRCMEESLRFADDLNMRQKLQRLYQTNMPQSTVSTSVPWLFAGVIGVMLASTLAGVITGILDVIPLYLLGSLYGSSDSIFVAILSWVPLVVAIFFSILWIRSLIGAVIRKNKITSALYGVVLALIAAFVFLYQTLQSIAFLSNIYRLLNTFGYSVMDGLFAIRTILLTGGVQMLMNNLKYGELSSFIFMALLFSGFGLCVYACVKAALESQKWQARLAEIRNSVAAPDTDHSTVWMWLPHGIMFFAFVMFAALLYPGKIVNVEEAFFKSELALDHINKFEYDQALIEFENSSAIWPGAVITHVNLALGYSYTRQFDAAMSEIQAAREISPDNMVANLMAGFVHISLGEYQTAITDLKTVIEQDQASGLAHAHLANLYYLVDEIELSEEELQTALKYVNGDAQTNSAVAGYYFQRRDLDMAVYHTLESIRMGNSSQEYLSLSRLYLYQGDVVQAETAIEAAMELGVDPVELYIAQSNLAQYKGDLAESESILLDALDKYSDNSDLLSDLSFVHFQMARTEKALQEAERAIETNPYNGVSYVELAYAYEKQGRLEEALSAAQKGVIFLPKYDRSHYILGLIYMDMDMKVEAVREFELFEDLYIDRIYVRENMELAREYLEQLK